MIQAFREKGFIFLIIYLWKMLTSVLRALDKKFKVEILS